MGHNQDGSSRHGGSQLRHGAMGAVAIGAVAMGAAAMGAVAKVWATASACEVTGRARGWHRGACQAWASRPRRGPPRPWIQAPGTVCASKGGRPTDH